jgi:hypothetical protein
MLCKYFLVDKETNERLRISGVSLDWDRKPSNNNQAYKIITTLCPDKYDLIEQGFSEREYIEEYLKSDKVKSIKPLKLGLDSNISILTKSELDKLKTLDDKILKILTLCYRYNSYIVGETHFETSSGRSRSSLDLWRHIVYFYPEVTIFEVMKSLVNLYESHKVGELFCSTVHRRVFYSTNSNYYSYYGFGNTKDEYKLTLKQWKDI